MKRKIFIKNLVLSDLESEFEIRTYIEHLNKICDSELPPLSLKLRSGGF